MKTAAAVFTSLRPKQWTKNLLIFAGILFSQNIFAVHMLLSVFGAFLVFCLLSGSVYIINDIVDADRDRKHPLKSKRPIASGALDTRTAYASFIVIVTACLAASFYLGPWFFAVALTYLFLQVAYSFLIKHVVILDVFTIAAGFVLRVVAGAVVIEVEISSWLIICTILLSLFLGLSKRRHELASFEQNAHEHRKVLGDYSIYLLDQMISVVTASTVVCYALYTMSDATIEKFGTSNLIFTVPFVLYGIFRYLYLVHKKGEGGNPENILVSDAPLIIDIFLWAAASLAILYV
jgi:4-hydroxybenzoate polyprenyltransferase